MSVFINVGQVYKYLGGNFEEAFADPELGPKFAASRGAAFGLQRPEVRDFG
jgi:hypothetical protein